MAVPGWIPSVAVGRDGHGQLDGRPSEHAMPMADALQQKTLLVFRMNGEPLPVDHGYPLRFFVPGFGANANVKWLGRLTITTAQPDFRRRRRTRSSSVPIIRPRASHPHCKTRRAVSSSSRRERRDRETANGVWEPYPWPGQSSNGGWWPAQFENEPKPNWWVRFYFNWQDPEPGSYRIASRASDALGRVQPPGATYPRRARGPRAPARRYRRTERAAGAEHITLAFRIACGTLVLLQLHAFRQVKGRAR